MLGSIGSKTLLPQPGFLNRRHSGVSPDLCNVRASPSTPGRCAARLATRPQQFPFNFAELDVSHAAHSDAAAAVRDVPIRHHLEVLYRTDSCPAACQQLAPQLLSSSSVEFAQRQPSVQMAVMQKEKEREQNESPSSKLEAAEAKLKQQDYYANVGDAIRTLREEVPLLFIVPLSCECAVHRVRDTPLRLANPHS